MLGISLVLLLLDGLHGALRPFTQDWIMWKLVGVLIEMWDVCRKEAMRMGNEDGGQNYC